MSLATLWQRLTGKSSQAIPAQFAQQKASEVPLLAIDLELTSLDAKIAKVLSIGWVSGQRNHVDLSSAYYGVIRAKGDLQQSPVIHGLTDDDIRKGEHVKQAVEALAPYVDSHIWLFHNTGLDIGVLNQVMINLGLHAPTVVTLDTLKLAVYQLQKRHQVLPPNSATLWVCRDRLDLPAAPAHNALDDALATLTLWYAQLYTLDPHNTMTVGDLQHTGALQVMSLGKPIARATGNSTSSQAS